MDSSQNISNLSNPSSQGDWNPFVVGEILDDKYEVVSLLGTGGMGAVYRVTQLLLKVDVAFKTLNTQRQNDATATRRFQTEARAAFSLKHPNLVNVHDFGLLQNNYPFLVMELIDGGTLQQYMQRGPLPLDEIRSIFVQLCFGLAYAHQSGIVHRDIKPGNIMLKRDVPLSVEGSVKILDFGLAKIMNTLNVDVESLTKTGDVIGSPLYMSPEQCSGAALDHRSDVYSLGCVLFEALTGTPPLVGSNSLRTMMLHQTQTAPTLKEAALGREFPESLERIVAKMLDKSPANRYTDLGVAALELSAACSGLTLPSFAETATYPALELPAKTSDKRISFSRLQLGSLISAIIFVSASAGYLFSAHSVQHQVVDADKGQAARDVAEITSKTAVGDYEDRLKQEALAVKEETRKIFDQAPPITHTAVMKAGQALRQINFPPRTIGTVEYSFQGEGSQKFKVEAVGTKDFPAAAPLIYHLSDREHPEVVSNFAVFDKIGKDIFAGLSFNGSLKGESFRGLDDNETPISDRPAGEPPATKILDTEHPTERAPDGKTGTLHLIQAACKWQNLNELSLSNTVITKEMISAIQQAKSLKHLNIRACQVNPEKLFDAKLTQQLERIDLAQLPANIILHRLAGSRNLKILDVGEGCSADASALSELETCPNLQILFLGIPPMSEEQLQAVLKIKSLITLSIKKTSLTDVQMKEILSSHWAQAPANMLNPNDPHVTFFRTKS